MRNIVLMLLVSFFGFSAQAQQKNKNARFAFEVNGNCEQCKKRIEKAAFSVPGVKSATWDVQTHQLTGIVNEEKATESDIKKAIAKAGHDTDEAKATQEQYEQLHHCCQYERKP